MNIFSRIFAIILNFLRKLQGTKAKPVLSPSLRSQSYIRPGDVFIFSYEGDEQEQKGPRLALIVAFIRGPEGTFVSNRNNKLVCCFKLTGDVTLMRVVIRSLYKNPAKSDYWKIKKVLIKLFGKENCRTYNLHKMRNMREVILRKDLIPPIEEEEDEPNPYAK